MRTMHDADAHIVEPPDWLLPYADPGVRARLEPYYAKEWAAHRKFLDDALQKHADPEYRAKDADEIWLRKNYWATGSFLKEDRSQALDLLGFRSQLIFNSSHMKELHNAEHGDDLDFAYGIARAHNRAVVDFCSVDPRLLPVDYVPLVDFERASKMGAEALETGCKALMIASACPKGHSPSHIALDPVWAQAQEAGIPIVLHVGGGGRLLDPAFFENGLPPVPDFHGGDGNFRSVDYMAICYPPMQTLAVMIIDGVLDRFPDLRVGAIELGASWVPGWMRNMDSAADVQHDRNAGVLSLGPYGVEGDVTGGVTLRTGRRDQQRFAAHVERLGCHLRGAVEVGERDVADRQQAPVDRAEVDDGAVVGPGDAVGVVQVIAVLGVVQFLHVRAVEDQLGLETQQVECLRAVLLEERARRPIVLP